MPLTNGSHSSDSSGPPSSRYATDISMSLFEFVWLATQIIRNFQMTTSFAIDHVNKKKIQNDTAEIYLNQAKLNYKFYQEYMEKLVNW